MEVTITRTRRHTVAHITATVIITARLTTTTTRELTAGMGLLPVPTDQRRGGLVIILTPARTLGAVRFRRLTGAEAQHKRITHTPAPMRRRDKVRARTLNGAVRMSRAGIKALPWATTRLQMEQWLVLRLRREEKRLPPARSGETVPLVKLPAVTCTLDTMVMSIRTPVTAGRSTTTEAGTR